MGLTYHFEFSAPASVDPSELENFLKDVESEAKAMGFDPTMVLNAQFDSTARRDFARRLTSGLHFEHEALKGVVILKEGQMWSHDPATGSGRLIPEQGVVLVVTDEEKRESVFGFLRYPDELVDHGGRIVAKTGVGRDWTFRESMKTSDPRYRKIVWRFAEAGYLKSAADDFAPS